MKKEKKHLIFVEVDWAIIHCLTFSFDYGGSHCGIVLISFCTTSQASFLSSVAFIFHHHLELTVGESDPCKEPSSHPRVRMGGRSHSGGRSMCKNKVFMLPEIHSQHEPDETQHCHLGICVKQKKNPLMEQPGHSYPGRLLISLGTSC